METNKSVLFEVHLVILDPPPGNMQEAMRELTEALSAIAFDLERSPHPCQTHILINVAPFATLSSTLLGLLGGMASGDYPTLKRVHVAGAREPIRRRMRQFLLVGPDDSPKGKVALCAGKDDFVSGLMNGRL